MRSPTQLTIEYLKKRGCTVRVTERWITLAKGGGIRRDVFGGDLQAIAGTDLLNIQATSLKNVKARHDKCLNNPEVKLWLNTGNKFQIWGWKKYPHLTKTGAATKVERWRATVLQLELVDGEIVARPFELRGKQRQAGV